MADVQAPPDVAGARDRQQQQQPQPPAGSGLLNRFRSVLLSSFSFVLTMVVIGNAYVQRQQFYPSIVYITKSNPR